MSHKYILGCLGDEDRQVPVSVEEGPLDTENGRSEILRDKMNQSKGQMRLWTLEGPLSNLSSTPSPSSLCLVMIPVSRRRRMVMKNVPSFCLPVTFPQRTKLINKCRK